MTPQTKQSFVIDTDTASDDAVAILLALQHPSVDVRALTIVAGNVPVEYGVRNAKITLDQVGRLDIPIYRGAERPMLRELQSAQHVHGEDGMSGVPLEVPDVEIQDQHAALALLDIATSEPGQHVLITLGPLTNIAIAIEIDPLFLTRFTHTYMMVGSSDARGNVAPTGEFNAWADPEAAKIVIEATGEKTMIGWDVSRKYALMTPEEDEALRSLGRLGKFSSDINDAVKVFASTISGVAGYDFPDPIAMAVALDESLITACQDLHLSVSLEPSTRGLTYADQREPAQPANTRVVTAVDETAFKAHLFELLTERSSS
jgi:purine nucleosidase